MDSDRWQHIQDIVVVALEQEPDGREEYVRQASNGDEELFDEVMSLLRSDTETAFISTSPPGVSPVEPETSSREHNGSSGALTGTTISHFEIQELLGQGGMGVVYKARDVDLDRSVALKFISPFLTADEQARKRLIVEAKTTSALDHPNICTVHEIGETDEETGHRLYIAMSYYDGETLEDRIKRGPIPFHEAVEIIGQAAAGLARAHEAGVIHRDIKPANIFITKRGLVKILDFGIAKMAGMTMTRTSGTVGTLMYMSPEQLQGKPVGQRTDVWSLGAVFYEMLTGRRPFEGAYEAELIYSILNLDPVAPSDVIEDLPDQINVITHNALAKNSDSRYASIAEMAVDINQVAAGKDPTATIEPTKVSKLPSMKTLAFSVIGVTAVAAVTFFATTRVSTSASRAAEAPDSVEEAVAVIPFSVSGDATQLKGDEIARLLSQSLFEGGFVTSVDFGTLRTRLEDETSQNPEPAAVVAQQLGGTQFVLGNISEIGGRLRVEATLYRNDLSVLRRASTEASAETDIGRIVDALLFQLLPSWPVSLKTSNRMLLFYPIAKAARTTRSGAALLEFARGLRHAYDDESWDMGDHLGRAVELDSTFALAVFLRAVYSREGGERDDRLLRQYRDRLEPLEQLGADRHLDIIPFETLNRRWQGLTILSDDYPTWESYANWLVIESSRNGRLTIDARSAVQRAWDLGPKSDLTDIAKIALLQRDYAWLDSLVVISEEKRGKPHTITRLMSAAARGDDAKLDELLPRIDDTGFFWGLAAGGKGAMYGQSMDGAMRVLNRALEAPDANDFTHGYVASVGALTQMANGRLKSGGLASLRAFDEYGNPDELATAVIYSLIEYYPPNPAHWMDIKRAVVAWDTTLDRSLAEFYDLYDGRYEELKAFLTAVMCHRLGETEEFGRHRSRIEEIAESKGRSSIAFAFVRTLNALQYYGLGDYERALEEVETARRAFKPEGENWYWSPIDDQLLDRMLRAESLFALERYEEALPWFFSLNDTGDPTVSGLALIGPAHHRAGFIYEKLGQPEKAIDYYTRVTEIWSDADPELQPYVQNAQDRVKALLEESVREPLQPPS